MAKTNLFIFQLAAILLVVSSANPKQRVCLPAFIARVQVSTSLEELLDISENLPRVAIWKINAWQTTEREPITDMIDRMCRKMEFLKDLDVKQQNKTCKASITVAERKVKKAKPELEAIEEYDHAKQFRITMSEKLSDHISYIKQLISECKQTPCTDSRKIKAVIDRYCQAHDGDCKRYDGIFMDQAMKVANIYKVAYDAIRNAEENCNARYN